MLDARFFYIKLIFITAGTCCVKEKSVGRVELGAHYETGGGVEILGFTKWRCRLNRRLADLANSVGEVELKSVFTNVNLHS